MTTRLLTVRCLALLSAFAFAAAGQAKDLELWFIPMSQDGPAKGPLTKWVSENLPKLVPGVTVPNNYVPPIYQDAQQKLIDQGGRGKPDGTKGFLAALYAYQKPRFTQPTTPTFHKLP